MTLADGGCHGPTPSLGRPRSSLREDGQGTTGADDARMRSNHQWTAKIALVGATVFALAACGQDKSAVCVEADELQASVQNLRDVTISENGIGALGSALGQVRTELEQLGTEAKSEFQPEIDGVKASVDQLSSSLSAAKADPSATSLGGVGTALRSLDAAVKTLLDAVAGAC
jgi:hypothetical protein